nr:MAG TPA: hypothetical protein [Caudoviricetes sp.]
MMSSSNNCETKKAVLTVEAVQEHLAQTAQSRQCLSAKILQSWPKFGLCIKKN